MVGKAGMGSPVDKMKHSRRRKNKVKERVRSNIARDLITSGKYHQRIVLDKHGKEHDLNKLSNKDLIELIQEDE